MGSPSAPACSVAASPSSRSPEGNDQGSEIRVPYDKSRVNDAPHIDDYEGHLSQDRDADLYRFYGLADSDAPSDSGLPGWRTAER